MEGQSLLSNNSDVFACCSHFRQCSDAGRCVIPDADYAANCYYRGCIEKGRVFFGKTAEHFDGEYYAALLQRIATLSAGAKDVFDSLVVYFCEYCPGATSYVVRSTYTDELAAVGLFDFRPLGAEFFNLCATGDCLRSVKGLASFGEAKQKRKAELDPLRKPLLSAKKDAKMRNDTAEMKRIDDELKKLYLTMPSETSAEFFFDWMNHDGSAVRDRIAEPYRLVGVRTLCAQYMTEYYHDELASGYDSRIYALSPLAADGYYKPMDWKKDETRRIKLSHGYSSEEKASRLAALEGDISAPKAVLDLSIFR